ncbi:MAG: [ribosomal protein S5]-alanine N-acetyltransferase [Campylobacterota bacterium]|nr:[ribosomal protein S5]-alanine N-acetyltransferase [Campylobacterota bacterium]
MRLAGRQIYLRPLELYDSNGSYPNWLNNPEVCRYNSHGESLYTREMAHTYIANTIDSPTIKVFAICLNDTNQHVGNISLQQISTKNQSAEFAILLGEPSVYGRGIGYEAGQLLLEYAFTTLELHRIHCGTHIENIGMQRLALKLGMIKEGIRRDALFKNNQFADIVEYGLLYNDYLKGQQ